MLSPRIIFDLNLTPIGSSKFRGIHGVAERFVYLVHIVFYGDRVSKKFLKQRTIVTDKIVHKAYIIPTPIEVGEIEQQLHFDVLLGMDVLKTGSLRVDSDGTFSFSF